MDGWFGAPNPLIRIPMRVHMIQSFIFIANLVAPKYIYTSARFLWNVETQIAQKSFWLFKDNLEEQIELDSQVWDDLENPLDEG